MLLAETLDGQEACGMSFSSTNGTRKCENGMLGTKKLQRNTSADAAAALRLRSSAPLAFNSSWDWYPGAGLDQKPQVWGSTLASMPWSS